MSDSFETPSSFEDLLSGGFDAFGLLKDVKPAVKRREASSPVQQRFCEILEFFERSGRVPQPDATEFQERSLAARLASYRARPELKAQVEELDYPHLLSELRERKPQKNTDKSFTSFDELLQSDESGLLSGIDASIFQLEHVSSAEPDMRNMPEEIATRKKCEDFYRFEKLFEDTQRDILNRKAQTLRFKNESLMQVGDIYILSGLLCLVDGVLSEEKTAKGRDNPRYRVIFENGIETNILKLSFSRALYKDPHGRRVIPQVDLTKTMHGITHRDRATGCIYVLASETKSPVLAELKLQGRLVKIGYSSQNVEERIKGAETDPTFLEAPVRILASIDCYNLNPQKVEHLIHAFLSKQRINMTLISSKGIPYKPSEWFAVDRDTAIAVAEHVVRGDIMEYRMDNTTGRMRRVSDE